MAEGTKSSSTVAMDSSASLMEKYKLNSSDPSSYAELHQKIVESTPNWDKYEVTKADARHLKHILFSDSALKTKAVLQHHPNIMKTLMDALLIQDDTKPVKWILALFYDMLREDSSCFGLFEDALKLQSPFLQPILTLLGRQQVDEYVADKAAWLMTAVMGNASQCFSSADVEAALKSLLEPKEYSFTNLGILEALTNLIKSNTFRSLVWNTPGVPERIFSVSPKEDPPHLVYRFAFAIWMLTFDPKITGELVNFAVIKSIKDILIFTRTEKTVRICLTILKNLLGHRQLIEEIVEGGILEAVQQLEFEKWRDAELYDDIRDTASQLSTEVQEMSNFDRYEKELQSGTLSWGFIHSPKFWSENVLKFEQNDFRALKTLRDLILHFNTEPATLAVACHDLGEFVTMHPLGKKKVAQMCVKERLMQLMGTADPAYREVRREALLCCQKLMLNKWQEMEVPQ